MCIFYNILVGNYLRGRGFPFKSILQISGFLGMLFEGIFFYLQ